LHRFNIARASKRGEAPLSKNHPLSFEGEGDKGGEVERKGVYQCFSSHPPTKVLPLKQICEIPPYFF